VRPGYTSIGEIDTDLGLVVFSHNGVQSEIGLVDPDSDSIDILAANAYRPAGYRFAYYTLYNDQFDPNGDRLDFATAPHFQPTTEQENKLISRIYWAVGNQGLRLLNLRLCFDAAGQFYHDSILSGALASYPRHLSVHQMDVLPDVAFGSLEYERRIDGSLLSGGYQISYRYRNADGHASPFAPILTRPYFVSDKAIPTNPEISHHARYMGASGVTTSDGLQFRLTGVDLRWDTLEIAVLYHRGAVGAERALLTHRIPLSTNPADSTSILISIISFTGTSINTAEFLSQQQNFETVQTVASGNNQLYVGGVKLTPALLVDATRVTHGFCEQLFRPDTTVAPTFKEKVNPENPSRKDGDKLTNSFPSTTTRKTALYIDKAGQPVYRNLLVENDYDHSKGVQVATRLTGYRRGETYPFSMVCLDTKGIPYFAVPLGDITFPDWAASPPTRGQSIKIPILGGSITISIPLYSTAHLGVTFNGIRLPASMVYTASGKRRLGSIIICRGEASGRIGFQALAVNCTVNVVTDSSVEDSDQGFKTVKPHSSWNNAFSVKNSGFGGGPSHFGPHDNRVIDTNVINQGAIVEISFKGKTEEPAYTINKAYWVTLHAPDVLTRGGLPDLTSDATARLQLLGSAHGASGNEIRMDIAEQRPRFPQALDGPLHVYTKNYRTNGQMLAGGEANGRPKLGSKTRIKRAFTHNRESRKFIYADIDPENEKLVFDPKVSLMTQINDVHFNGTTQPEYRLRWGSGGNYRLGQSKWAWNFIDAILHPGAIIAKLLDWETVDVIESRSSYVSLSVVNFVKGADIQPAADERTYIPTGYMLNITDELLSTLPVDTDKAGKVTAFVINGAEVYGGDTTVSLVDICRLYPLWSEDCERRNSYTPDYGVGHIVPMESQYNYGLRQGRSLANNGMYTQSAACENENLHATGGIAWGQPEEWNLNDVLTPKETIALYKPLPATVKLTDDRPASIYSSQPKVYGERDDSYRQWRPLDYTDLDGSKGPVMRMEPILNGIYVFQRRDYGRLRARERAIVPTSVGELTTGTGKNLDGVEYGGHGVGLHEFNAMVNGGIRLYWLDSERKLLCRFSQAGRDELSEREHAHDLFMLSVPNLGVDKLAMGIDERHGDVWITYGKAFVSATRTVIYNEKLDSFVNDQTDCQAVRYVNWRGKLYGINPLHKEQTHIYGTGPLGVYFDRQYNAELGWIANPQAIYPKTFDNMAISVEGYPALVQLEMRTRSDYQVVNLLTHPRVRWRESRLWMPLMSEQPGAGRRANPRLRDQYLSLLLTIDPTRLGPGERFSLTATDILYRLSPKI
jgi:hypothetical protein